MTAFDSPLRPDATAELMELLKLRILVIDGAMGMMIQRYAPGEGEYRGDRFADWPSDVKGNSDLAVAPEPRRVFLGVQARLQRHARGRTPLRYTSARSTMPSRMVAGTSCSIVTSSMGGPLVAPMEATGP